MRDEAEQHHCAHFNLQTSSLSFRINLNNLLNVKTEGQSVTDQEVLDACKVSVAQEFGVGKFREAVSPRTLLRTCLYQVKIIITREN